MLIYRGKKNLQFDFLQHFTPRICFWNLKRQSSQFHRCEPDETSFDPVQLPNLFARLTLFVRNTCLLWIPPNWQIPSNHRIEALKSDASPYLKPHFEASREPQPFLSLARTRKLDKHVHIIHISTHTYIHIFHRDSRDGGSNVKKHSGAIEVAQPTTTERAKSTGRRMDRQTDERTEGEGGGNIP